MYDRSVVRQKFSKIFLTVYVTVLTHCSMLHGVLAREVKHANILYSLRAEQTMLSSRRRGRWS